MEDYNNALNLLAKKLSSNLLKVNLSGNGYVNDPSLLQLCIKCEFLQEVLILHCPFITHAGIALAIRHRPSFNSLSVSNLSVDPMQIDEFNDYFIHSLATLKRLTCLDLSFSGISDVLLYSIALDDLPLKKLVLQGCYNYSFTGISYLLSKCQSLQHLDLRHAMFLDDRCFNQLCAFLPDLVSINVSCCNKLTNYLSLHSLPTFLCSRRLEWSRQILDSVQHHPCWIWISLYTLDSRHLEFACFPCAKTFSIDFQASNLELLNLSKSTMDDQELDKISKIFPRLLQLDLGHCYDVTDKGVMLAIENCTHLREINLRQCRKVSTNIVSSMIVSRPSLRKITAPPNFHLRDCERKLLFRQCLVF